MTKYQTRGMRNNNPLNVRKTKSKWLGSEESPIEHDFVTFKNPVWGFRAAFRILSTYYWKHHLCSLEAIISRWAPSNENDTNAYIEAVEQYSGISRRRLLPAPNWKNKETWVTLALAMCRVENGIIPRNYDIYASSGYDYYLGK